MNATERINLTKMTIDAYNKGTITIDIAKNKLDALKKQRDTFFKNYLENNPNGTFEKLQLESRKNAEQTDFYKIEEELEHIINVLRNYSVKVGDGVTHYGYSDREPYTIIARTKSTLTIQEDKCEKHPDWKAQWVPGGFSAVCTNIDDQEWIITPDKTGRIIKVYWSNASGCWKWKGYANVYEGRYKYYDYNF